MSASPSVTAAPTPPGVLATASILAGRIIRGWRTELGPVIIAWLFPILVTLLFLGLFGGALHMPSGERYVDFLMPGMLAVTMLFGLESTTLTAAADAARGINDRFRSLPINASAIVLGKCLADLANSLIGLLVMAGFGFVLGWRPQVGPVDAVLALGLLMLLRFALLWIGIFIGYRARSVESVAYVQILVWPVAFLSSVFVDPGTMPAWLGAMAEVNPISATATTLRGLLGTTSWSAQLQPAAVSSLLSVGWPLILTAVFLPLAARSFRSKRA